MSAVEGIEADVVVIGGGAAGAVAALAAREAGLRVAVVRRAYGATAVSSGAADLAPDPVASAASPRGDRRSVRASVEALALRRPDHPYAVLRRRLGELDEALAFAAAATGGALAFAPLDGENRLLLSPLGTVKATAGGLPSILAGELGGAGTVGVVGFDLWPAFDARVVAAGGTEAAARAGLSARLVPVLLDFLRGAEDPALLPHEVAARIAAPGGVERLAGSIRRAVAGLAVDRLLLPPVLPDDGAIRARLGEALGIPWAETPAGPPSLPGLRLQRLLDRRLNAAGIALHHGEAVARGGVLHLRDASPTVLPAERFDGGLEGVEAVAGAAAVVPPEPPLAPVQAKAVVLATGKFLGGGLARRNTVEETVFGLPVWPGAPVEPTRWPGDLTAPDLAAEQPYFRAGVRIDDRLRPLGAGGGPARPDLFACGAVLAGNDPARDGAGLGLAMFTGYLAGRGAAAVARGGRG
jgi:glycerol-3-phosphate dehydrogenase subunit B